MKRLARLPKGGVHDWPSVAGDFNLDGRMDLVFATGVPAQVQFWTCKHGNEYFLAHADTAVHTEPGIVPGDFRPSDGGDFDNDGLPDLVGLGFELVDPSRMTYWNIVALVESPGSGEFPTETVWYDRISRMNVSHHRVYIAPDMDRDGRPELVTFGDNERAGLNVYELRGDDSLVLVYRTDTLWNLTAATGDFDLDARYEIATWHHVTLTAECTGDDQYWVPPWRDTVLRFNPYDVFAGRDVDQNGKPEYFLHCCMYQGMGWEHYLYYWEAIGDNQYRHALIDVAGGGAGGMSRCGDVDADGVEEVVWAANENVRMYKAVVPGRFDLVFNCTIVGSPAITIADLNQNGYNEVVVCASITDIYEVEAVRVLTPNGGEALWPGDTVRVSWQTFDPPRSDSVGLFLRRDTTWQLDTIATGLGLCDTPYVWVVPETRADSCWLVAIAYGPTAWQWDETDVPLRIAVGVEEWEPLPRYELQLEVNSNPAAGRACVQYEVAVPGPVRIAVYDRAGRMAAELASGWHEPGRYESRGPGGRLPAGVYFVRLVSGGERRDLKLVLARR